MLLHVGTAKILGEPHDVFLWDWSGLGLWLCSPGVPTALNSNVYRRVAGAGSRSLERHPNVARRRHLFVYTGADTTAVDPSIVSELALPRIGQPEAATTVGLR